MKKLLYLLLLVPVFTLFSCEKDMEVYNAPNNDRLNFIFEEDADTLIMYTFIYSPEEQKTDTVWMDIETSGYVTDYPRTISFKQLPVDSNTAIAGTHYVPFDDPSMTNVYVVPANKSKVHLPLILKKEDPTLTEKEFILKIGFKENEFFKPGFSDTRERVVKISNKLTRPKNWTMYATYYFAGCYGKVKHRFMIDAGAKKGIRVDEDFFKGLVEDPGSVDMGETGYWNGVFANALKEENASRAANGLPPLREAPEAGETEGKLVEFILFDTSDF